jgi:hypothetical protein
MASMTSPSDTDAGAPFLELPLALRQSLEAGDCVLFIGAGIGRHLLRDGLPAPTGVELAGELAGEFKIESENPNNLAQIAQIVEIRKGRMELETYLAKRLCGLQPDEALRWLCMQRWRAIFTTNYDDAIERAYAQTAAPPQTPIPISATPQLTTFDRRFQVPVYHLHGRLCGPERTHIIITENDYAEFRKQRQMTFELLKLEFATSVFLYIGYANSDPNWKMLLEELRSEFYPSKLPISYRISPSTDRLDQEILKSKGIDSISCTYDDFQKSATLALTGSKVPADALSRLQATVPTELLPAFDRNPAAVARLLNSWEYVNQAQFTGQPNIRDFFRGDKANWGLIAKKIAFERDLEDEVYDALLDYGTSSSVHPSTVAILAPAGYGTTTFLRQIASRLVADRAGSVLLHREGAPLDRGDIEFAVSLFPSDCPYFVIDSAADEASEIYDVVHDLRDANKRAMFLLGERLNEWRFVRRGRAPGREFILEPLSDPEIERLLGSLEENNELNALAHLSHELQVVAIKQNYQQELLVTLREATEGRAFDAILADEFRSIPNDIGRRLYLIVSCFYQHGAMVRDSLIAEIMGVSLDKLYPATAEATLGVVVFEETDPSFGISPHASVTAKSRPSCGKGAQKRGNERKLSSAHFPK